MQLVQRLTQAASTAANDPALTAFYQALQMVLFGGDLEESGRGLTGLYRQAWQALVLAVRGEGILQWLQQIMHNTVVVLKHAPERAGEWREALTELRNQAVGAGDSQLASLLDAILGLLAANGDPAGLGRDLQSPYAEVWNAILAQIQAG